MDPSAAERIGQNYQDWIDFFRKGAGGLDLGGMLRRLVPSPPPVTAPEAQAAAPQAAPEEPQAAAPPPAEPGEEPTTLERFKAQLTSTQTALAAAEALAANQDEPPDVRQRAAAAATTLRGQVTTILTQIAAEENRQRDEATGAKPPPTPTITQVAIPGQPGMTQPSVWDPKANDGKGALVPALGPDGKPLPPSGTPQEAKPKNGDKRTRSVEHKGVYGTVTDTYNNGTWSEDANSFKLAEGFLGTKAPTNKSIWTDQQGNAFAFDPETGKIQPLNGAAGKGYTVATLADGNSWLVNAQGQPEKIVVEASPLTQIADNKLLVIDRNTGRIISQADLLDPNQRDRANKLADLAVRQAELGIQTAEQALQPKFASAEAQLVQEAQRRQQMARTELNRLLGLQKEGQISPDQAEAQFGRWMEANVEGPLSPYRAAAENERREREQANLTRQTAEDVRVEGAERSRQELAFRAGEEARTAGRALAARTRAPEYIQGLGGFARSLGEGRTDFKFDPAAFDPANFKKALPNVDAMADQAVSRLLARVAAPTRRDVNVPLGEGLPTGPDLTALMNGVRYSGALTGAPQGEQPLPDQQAIDLRDLGRPGWARSVYPGGRTLDWEIPQIAPIS